MNKDLCKRCGKCCIIEYKGIKKPCKYLELDGLKTYCSIYEQRLGTLCATIHNTNFYCIPRALQKRKIEGCPLNKPF